MDRSFLSDPSVIAASRGFVCVRLMSYENKDEAALLKKIGASKSGEAENTVFCILAPDGKRMLLDATREPHGTVARLTETMTRIAKEYSGKAELKALPLIANPRLAVNVAACDHQPLVIIHAKDDANRRKLHDALKPIAWSSEFIGKFIYVDAASRKEFDFVEKVAADSAVIVVLPDTFGLNGKVLHEIAADASPRELAETLKTGLARFQRQERNFWQHVKLGQQKGVFWETQTPVTDPMELRAREKNRK
jgi:hypothetical protein